MKPTRRQAITSLCTALFATRYLAPARGPGRAGEPPRSPHHFLRAVRAGDLPRVRRMLAEDPNLARTIDDAGCSVFVLAHLAGHADVAAALRTHGLELDAVEAVLAEDWERLAALVAAEPAKMHVAHPIGGTPVYAAALCGSLAFWRLRSHGYDADAAPDGGTGFTPARGAMDSPRIEWARIAVSDLLGNGGDANAPQRDGDSVLHGAVRRRSDILVRLAIRKGAAVDAVDAEGRTPADLAAQLEWASGVELLADHLSLPRDNRASRFALDANRQPIVRPDLEDVPQDTQNEVTGSSHARLARVRELVAADRRLIFSISTDDELAIEASAHVGNRPLMRFHLDHGAPLSLPTAVSLGDREAIAYWLRRDPTLVHERGAHDFPLLWYALLGGGGPEIAEILVSHGAAIEQESVGTTTLHWCALRDDAALASWLIEKGAVIEAVGYKWSRAGQTPLQLANEHQSDAVAKLLRDAGAKQ